MVTLSRDVIKQRLFEKNACWLLQNQASQNSSLSKEIVNIYFFLCLSSVYPYGSAHLFLYEANPEI